MVVSLWNKWENTEWGKNNRYLSGKTTADNQLIQTHWSVTAPFLTDCVCISDVCAGYPSDQAVHEVLATVREYLDEHHDKVRVAVRVCVSAWLAIFPTVPSRYYAFHSCCFLFPSESEEKSILIKHIHAHTVTHSGARAHGQVCILIGSLRDLTRLTQTHTCKAHTLPLRRNSEQRKDQMMESG